MTISAINLGSTFTNANGTPVLSGLSSGIDTQSTINAIVAAQSAQITPLQDRVTVDNSQLSALTQLQNILTAIQTAAAPLSDPQSPDASSNLWADTTSTITGNTEQAASNYLTADVTSTATPGTYTISNISQIATATTQESQAFTVSPSSTAVVVSSGAVSGQFNAGTFTVNGPSGSASVTFTAGQNLNQIAADFNAADSTTGLEASVKQTATGVYTLEFTNLSTNASDSFDLTSSSNITDPSGVFHAQTSATYTLSAATNPVVVSSGATSGQFNAGTFTLTGASGSATITVTAGQTLSEVAADFNAQESSTGISANVLQTSPGVYNLVFSSTTTGAATLFDLTNTASGATSTVTNDTNNVLGNVTFQAMTSGAGGNEGQDAVFELNGATITRPTNTITDLISGVTLNLLASAPSSTFTLQVTPDTSSIATGISNFAAAYNDFLTFYAQQTQLNSSGTPTSAAVLYSDTTLRNIYNQLTGAVSSVVSGLSTSVPNSLGSVGVNFTDQAATSTAPAISNVLAIDSATLQSALQSNFSAVENVFGYNLTSSSPNLILYQSSPNQTVSNFTITVDDSDPSSPVYNATYYDSGDSGPTTTVQLTAADAGSGSVTLTGPSGSALSGLQLIYSGNGSDSPITVSTTQGYAAQLDNFATNALVANTGLIATDQTAIQTKTTTLQTQITNITNQVATQRANLLTQFAQLEEAVTQANSALDYLNAQQAAATSSS